MTLTSVAADLRRRNALQLYDDWHGYYILVRTVNGQRRHVRRLSRDEAMTYRTRKGESLLLKWKQGATCKGA